MKSARPTEVNASAACQGATIVISPAPSVNEPTTAPVPGFLPTRHNTVRAEVLARLLIGSHMTGMDGVFGASTTRLSAVVHALERDYGWSINRRRKVVDAKDGRTPTIAVYYFHPDMLEAAAPSCRAWVEQVFAARSAMRHAEELRRKAERQAKEAARHARRFHDPRQFGLGLEG